MEENSRKITLVTGLWDINRGALGDGWSRSYDHYLQKFAQLLTTEDNLIIFGDENLKDFVFERRDPVNTQFVLRNVSWFKSEFYDAIQKIRLDDNWLNLASWLKDSTQAKLEMYNPIVMSKMFLLHDAKILDSFDSEYLFWIDAGITNTVHPGYFTHDKVIPKLADIVKKFSFVCFPYKAENEIHGFEFEAINSFANEKIEKVARGGFFGGPKNTIPQINSIYYEILKSTLNDGYMGTEESIFSIMTYKHPEVIDYFLIESNGLLAKFFEDIKTNSLVVRTEKVKRIQYDYQGELKVGLYVIGFNSPNQFRTLINSMLEFDSEFIDKTEKFLLNNSSDETTLEEYLHLCDEFNFTHIKKDNLGICGGRQFIAEHFQESNLDFYFFFEDDMFFCDKNTKVCRNGFNRHVENFYQKTVEIMLKESFDFLKLNFSEFFGDNSVQWSWYNVPQTIRETFWPDNPKLPKMGLDPNAPKTRYNNILTHRGVPYVTGEIYYSNWPQIVSRSGNEKMFLETTWKHPYEQTWMSHFYQLTKKETLNPGLLLMTPTEHNRFEHYDGKLRKES